MWYCAKFKDRCSILLYMVLYRFMALGCRWGSYSMMGSKASLAHQFGCKCLWKGGCRCPARFSPRRSFSFQVKKMDSAGDDSPPNPWRRGGGDTDAVPQVFRWQISHTGAEMSCQTTGSGRPAVLLWPEPWWPWHTSCLILSTLIFWYYLTNVTSFS